MPESSEDAPRRSGLRWLAGAVAVAVAAVVGVALAPSSSASTTITAQLSLSGVATQSNILGGTTVGVHPGDTVDFKAAALPTAGLDNIPTLGPLLDQLVTTLLHTQYQVVLHLPSTFPGGKRDVTLGGPTSGTCKGAASLPVNFPTIGTYNFSWNVQYVLPGLLGCTKQSLNSSDLNLLKSIGVALNATNQWVGQIVVSNNPPGGGIAIQLPGVSVAPSVTGIGQLPTLGVPGVVVGTVPVTIPPISLPGGGGSSGGGGSTPPGGPSSTTECVPCHVVPSVGLGGGGSFGAPGPDAGGITQIGAGLHEPTVSSPTAGAPSESPKPTTKTTTRTHTDLASNRAPGAQVPVVLAIIAIIALALVGGSYARLYLLRRGA